MKPDKERLARLREKHKKKLEDIKDLKRSPNYIGTADAVRYLHSFEDNLWPEEFADAINAELPEDADFKATPDRVLRTLYVCNGWLNDFEVFPVDPSVDAGYIEKILGKPSVEAILRYNHKDKNPALLQIAKKLFGEISVPKDIGGEELTEQERERSFYIATVRYIDKEFSISKLFKQYNPDFPLQVDEDSHVTDKTVIQFMSGLVNLDMVNSESFRSGLRRDSIDYNLFLQRIVRDQVDTRWDYGRQVALLCAGNRQDYASAKELIRQIHEVHATRKKRYANFQKMSVPEPILKHAETMVKESGALIRILENEKDFLNKAVYGIKER